MSRRNILIGGGAAIFLVAAGSATWAAWDLWSHSATPNSEPNIQPGPKAFISGVPTLRLSGHKDIVRYTRWSPDGKQLATAGDDHALMAWDIAASLKNSSKSLITIKQSQQRWRLNDAINYYQISWTSNGKKLMALTKSAETRNVIYQFDLASKSPDPTIYHNSSILDSDFSAPIYWKISCAPKGNRFVTSVLSSESMVLWDLSDTQRPIKTFNTSGQSASLTATILAMDWTPDGKRLAALNSHQQVLIFDDTGKLIQTLDLSDRLGQIKPGAQDLLQERFALEWCPNNSNLLAVSNVDVIDIWDIQQKRQLRRLETDDPSAHQSNETDKTSPFPWYPQVCGLTWSPNGRFIAASFSRSTLIHVWDLQNPSPAKSKYGNELQTTLFGNPGHANTILDIAWQPGEGRYIATASMDNSVIIWRVEA
ncbi:hypothetical protein KSX_82750 [Ktedonospora formicarum]|uniref:Uncharacterized protein n=1 Tax=Ktedonospora formicarum TaxID=2778364 RepID=A0A8J3MVB6_9CHLR|nr:hypothetical protein KSX_82750 [Ktedonospora formicarum]